MCGAISGYNLKKNPPIYYYPFVVSMSASMIGFIFDDYKHVFLVALKSLSKWVDEGKIIYREHILNGLENAPKALSMLFTGENKGKMIIKVFSTSVKL